jgi:inosine-uridine nucleoside N-ribohydrolase
MSSAIINFPPPRAQAPFVHKDGSIDLNALQNFLALYNGAQLETVSTAGGNANFSVPASNAVNQNKEIVYVKISADGNTPTLVPIVATDKINGGASVAMGTAQYSKLRLKADGAGNWYVVG